MMSKFEPLNAKFSAMTQREKSLVAIGGAVGVFMLMLTFLLEPAMERQSKQTNQLQSVELAAIRAQSEIARVTNILKGDPDKDVDIKLEQLQLQSELLDAQLDEIVKNLVTPNQMAELLEQVLNSSKNLKLQSLQSLPAEPIMSNGQAVNAGYFIHPVRIELSGKYFDIQTYLSTLEAMPVRYFWRSFQYQVDEYPTANLTLVVYTLGTGQEFIGG
ncbi:type 4a pilus biogenesis protein PilO [Vibrio tapetis]|uniref:Putative MSHA biogenesis protein MshJ n=1 Tax=Vibrio tapetis subsp. tapetis TaxID=1671868 RepID=A0A2N8ZFL8_9VIBR|nr:type 4a pilus biogenesis protein PilO [Vibrio tapetis]SON50690.1 putative MSHA biogenesis protein MshJ [Vibrio tapetis subsp. tapetis]